MAITHPQPVEKISDQIVIAAIHADLGMEGAHFTTEAISKEQN